MWNEITLNLQFSIIHPLNFQNTNWLTDSELLKYFYLCRIIFSLPLKIFLWKCIWSWILMNHIFQDQVESEEGGGIQPGVLPRRVQRGGSSCLRQLVSCGGHDNIVKHRFLVCLWAPPALRIGGAILSYFAIVPNHASWILRFLHGTPSTYPG